MTLADAHYGRLIDMGTGFDDFSPRAKAFATDGVSAQQQANRAWLREGMKAGGLEVYSGEWWHFDGPGAGDGSPDPGRPAELTSRLYRERACLHTTRRDIAHKRARSR